MSKRVAIVLLPLLAFGAPCASTRSPDAGARGGTVVSDPGEIPVATGSSALFQPGGIALVQGRLSDRGYLARPNPAGRLDSSTRAALVRFQQEQQLPCTGVPTYMTVERLGLEVERVFRTVGPEPRSPGALNQKPSSAAR